MTKQELDEQIAAFAMLLRVAKYLEDRRLEGVDLLAEKAWILKDRIEGYFKNLEIN